MNGGICWGRPGPRRGCSAIHGWMCWIVNEKALSYMCTLYVTRTFRSPLTILLFAIWGILHWTSFSVPPIQPNRLQEVIKAGLKRTRILPRKGGHANDRVIKFHAFRIHAATLRCSSGILRSVSWQLATSHKHECLTYAAVRAWKETCERLPSVLYLHLTVHENDILAAKRTLAAHGARQKRCSHTWSAHQTGLFSALHTKWQWSQHLMRY